MRVWLWAVCAVLGWASASDGQTLDAWGMRALSPPVPATAVQLKDIRGGMLSLEKERGHYVLLTFFATWCGPCASEMPSLELLYQSRKNQGLRVLAIAVDSTPEDVAVWVKEKGLSFPVAVDTQGEVAAAYSTGGIPVSFLVSPAGEIVGVAQGAREWGSFASVLDTLQKKPGSVSQNQAYKAQKAAVSLPADVKPPVAEVRAENPQVKVDVPFDVTAEITWAGNMNDYVLLPPTLHTPEHVEVLSTQASSSSEGGSHKVLYTLRCVAHQEGSFSLHPVDIRFVPRGSQEPMSARAHGPTVQVLSAYNRRWVVWGAAGSAALLVAGAACAVFYLRRTRRAQEQQPHTPHTHARVSCAEGLQRMAVHAQSGNALAFLQEALQCAVALEIPQKAVQDIRDMMEKVQYAGHTPNPEDLQALQRQLQRLSRETLS